MYQVNWHSGARPSHQEWQGKWYTHAQIAFVCGLGELTNATVKPIIEVKQSDVITTGGILNSITQTTTAKDGIERNY